jgi:predicted flap endonuclease-1-like 5' DNA nuclease
VPYTLAKYLGWLIPAVLLGGGFGWLLARMSSSTVTTTAALLPTAETDRLRARVANLEAVVAERDRLKGELDDCRAAARKPAASTPALRGFVSTSAPAPAPVADVAPPMPDLSLAATVLGRSIKGNDLKVIEGIGPKIEELCHAKGILTWWDLSTADAPTLQAMLNEAGPRFQMHDPSNWPEQARLLATGAFEQFKQLTDRLEGGRATD